MVDAYKRGICNMMLGTYVSIEEEACCCGTDIFASFIYSSWREPASRRHRADGSDAKA
jgi:hypothetical protein